LVLISKKFSWFFFHRRVSGGGDESLQDAGEIGFGFNVVDFGE
jgi:hypothetical protein